MALSNRSNFPNTEIELNTFQRLSFNAYKDVFEKENVSADIFKGYPSFSNRYFVRAFSYFIKDKNLSIRETLEILAKLTDDEAWGVSHGLDQAAVKGLTKPQIKAMVKSGLTREEVEDLNEFQIDVYLRLRHLGITPSILRTNDCISTIGEASTLGYLISIQKRSVTEALSMVSQCDNDAHLRGVCWGLNINDYRNMDAKDAERCMRELVQKKYKKLDFSKLNEAQKTLAQFMFQSVNVEEIRKLAWITSETQVEALTYLIGERFMEFGAALEEVKDLTGPQLEGIKQGLPRKEVECLTHVAQMQALKDARTSTNGLTAASFAGSETWFTHDDHVMAFRDMLDCSEYIGKHLNPEEAFAELKELSPLYANRIYYGDTRSQALALTKAAIYFIHGFINYDPTRVEPFRGQMWVNEKHTAALVKLVVKEGKFKKEWLEILKTMNDESLDAFITGNQYELFDPKPIPTADVNNNNNINPVANNTDKQKKHWLYRFTHFKHHAKATMKSDEKTKPTSTPHRKSQCRPS